MNNKIIQPSLLSSLSSDELINLYRQGYKLETTDTIVSSITLTGCGANHSIGDTCTITAECKDSNGTVITCPAITWTSSNPSIVSVTSLINNKGICTSLSLGSSTITASIGTVTATITVNVTTSVPITLSGCSAPHIPGDTCTITAICRDTSGVIITCPSLTWISSNPTIVSISSSTSTCIATAVAIGSSVITVTDTNGNTASKTVNVNSSTAKYKCVDNVCVQDDVNGTLTSCINPCGEFIPSITSIIPTTSTSNIETSIIITGSNFDSTTFVNIFENDIYVNGVVTNLVIVSSTSITCNVTLPHAITYKIGVRNGSTGTLSNLISFTVTEPLPRPILVSVSPESYTYGIPQTITLIGSNFRVGAVALFYKGSVFYNDSSNDNPVITPTSIIFTRTFESVSTPYNIYVKNNDGQISYDGVTINVVEPQLKYKCKDNECVEDSNGTFTEPTCNNECEPSEKKYSCKDGKCEEDSDGEFADSSCEDTCVLPKKYKCDSNGICVRDDTNGTFTTDNCDNTCAKPSNNTSMLLAIGAGVGLLYILSRK